MCGTESEVLLITLPIPPAECSPNVRSHWAKKCRVTKKAREDAFLAAVSARHASSLSFPFPGAVVRITWLSRDRRGLRADNDNRIASLKAYFDGITDAGVWRDDRGVEFRIASMDVDQKNPRVILAVQRTAHRPR